MPLTDLLRKIVTPIRVSPHGALAAISSFTVIGLDHYFNDNSLIEISSVIAGFLMGSATVFYIGGLESYKKTLLNIEEHGCLNEKSVHNHATSYCNRQGARVAAINKGYKEKFDQYLKTAPQKSLNFIPLI